MKRIALVFAHPDDETFCVGGIAAKFAAAGVAIDLFCATNGDAGKNAGVPVSSREELAAVRQAETRAACDVLGIGSIELAGYGDGALESVSANQLTGDIVAFLRRTRPTIVVTFGPEGAPTGHRDHRAISRAATAAFFLSGLETAYPDQALAPWSARRLFYHAWEPPPAGSKMPLESVPYTCSVDVRDHRGAKEAAFRAHASQQGSSWAFYELALKDAEQLALAAGVAQPRAVIDDPFEGLG